MPGIALTRARAIAHCRKWLVILLPIWLMGCATGDLEPPLQLKFYQQWQLQRGDVVAGRSILGGLGDISIALDRQSVYAPFNGRTQRDPQGCLIFSSPDVPAYLFRLCGLDQPKLGTVNQGDRLGSGTTLQFAALRKQPNGTWALVEPSRQILERILTP